MISDLELVQQVTIKQFHKFHSRKPFALSGKKRVRDNLFTASGDQWKRLRSVASPSFTTRRMKEMSPLINQSVDDLLKLFDRRCEEKQPFDIYSEFGRLTTDVISSCAFGIDSGCLKDPSSPFLVETRKAFERLETLPTKLKAMMLVHTLFPTLVDNIRKIYPHFLESNLSSWSVRMARNMILERQRSNDTGGRVDFINLMLATNKQVGKGQISIEKQEKDEYDKEGFLDVDVNQLKKSQPMTIDEMIQQVTLFLNAGYETTSTALGFTSYELAVNPDVQAKLQQEIDAHFPTENKKQDYNDLQKLKYMECVMKEVLRIHPIAPVATTRLTSEDMTYKDVTIPKGVNVRIDMDELHFNPEFWGKHDPQKFVPERFEEDCQDTPSTLAWCPFGAGPRICLGMRFAVMEYKIALIRILKRFNIKRCPETKVPCPTRVNAVYSPSQGVTVMLEKRA